MAKIDLQDSQDLETRSGFLPLLVMLLVLIALIFGGGYYFLQQPSGKALLDKAQVALGLEQPAQDVNVMQSENTITKKEVKLENQMSSLQMPENAMPKSKSNVSDVAKDEEIKRLQNALEQKEKELVSLSKSVDGLNMSLKELQSAKQNTQQIQNTIRKLRYTIKPKRQIIAECFSMEVGRWDIPKSCLLSIATKVDKELQEDKRVVAFEVQGIVDTNPYRGLSAELKQEGLASFRAWNAIRSINEKIPNATIFEGPSLQLANKRGYSIKAYFVE